MTEAPRIKVEGQRVDMAQADEKNARLTVRLKAKSGYNAVTEAQVSLNQWAAIIAIVEVQPTPAEAAHLASLDAARSDCELALSISRGMEAERDAVTRERDTMASDRTDWSRRALLAEQRLAIAEEALGKCRDQFDFYAREHRTAQKHAKAETNQQFADLCSETLAKLKDTPK